MNKTTTCKLLGAALVAGGLLATSAQAAILADARGEPASSHRSEANAPTLTTPDTLNGINKMWGDGRVEWKDTSAFDLATMGSNAGLGTPENHYVNNNVVAVPY